jgi:hypothetical protein
MTSVEWLDNVIKDLIPNDIGSQLKYKNKIEQAKEMQKQEMHKCASFWRGKENDIEKPIFDEYYNETYGK